ncbi:hypothetical protein D9Q98_008405 [Chlorella vulgaris]|uniref:Uncharacterized protein n=1 Tax=Chlorella vulgaris TaxID=3077 RepID=A0A9D4TGN4_CHLVU|nr:hypothetical protein D9Q98_008405 [Chlorella vulgaris]
MPRARVPRTLFVVLCPAAVAQMKPAAPAGSSLARTASLGPTSPSGPSRPTFTVTLKRSSSLPQQAPQRAASGSVSATSSTGTGGSPGSSASTSTSRLLNPSAAGYEPCCCGSHRGAGGSSGRSSVGEEEARRAACDSPTITSACPSGGGGGGPCEACGEQQGRRVAPPPAGCEGLQQQHPQPAEKLAKDDVMHSLFGGEECAEAGRQQPVAPISAAGHHAPPQFGSAQISRLLQQLALQDAQQQAAVVNAALAGQQHSGPRGEAFSQGPPSLLSPWDQLPAFMGGPPASHASLQGRQQGCAFNADALGAMIAACQTGALAQAAVTKQLLQLHASGLLAPPPLPPPPTNGYTSAGSGGSPTYSQGSSAAELPGERAPGPAVGWAGGTPVSVGGGMAPSPLSEQQHLPLPSLQPPFATPFGSIGSFRGSAVSTPSLSRSPTPAPTPSISDDSWAAGLSGSNSCGSTAGQPQLTPHASATSHLHNSRAVSCQTDNGCRSGSDSRFGVAPNRQLTFVHDSEQAVAPPRTVLPNGAAIMPAPPALDSATSAAAATAGAGIDGGSGGLRSSAAFQFAAEPRSHSRDRALNPSALPFNASLARSQPAHKGAPAAVVEQAGQEHGDNVSSYTSSMFQPTSDAPLARASSLPGSNGKSTQQLGHLSDLLSLARSNSFRANPPFQPPNAPAQDPPTAHPADYPSSFQSEATEQLHRALLAAATSGPQSTPAGASQFASAFSPRSAASLARPPPPPGRMAAPQLGTRCSSAPRDQFARRVDHMIDSMFHRQ